MLSFFLHAVQLKFAALSASHHRAVPCVEAVCTHSAGETQSEFRASGTHGRKCAQITQARAVALQIHCLAAAARQP